jgi:hypothetical protein
LTLKNTRDSQNVFTLKARDSSNGISAPLDKT